MCLGVPAKVVKIVDPINQIGLVETCGVRREVSLTCIADLPLDDLLGCWF
ncbi:HypC/HybG/HupF family hydrogenase formation chaperone [Vibrio sonorensis]|nr:HypC/HybG/HupF family hydrogenase formation chaperone [Vibrio sonorensis]